MRSCCTNYEIDRIWRKSEEERIDGTRKKFKVLEHNISNNFDSDGWRFSYVRVDGLG